MKSRWRGVQEKRKGGEEFEEEERRGDEGKEE